MRKQRLWIALMLLCSQPSLAKSLMPVPVFTSASVSATAEYDEAAGFYRYHYVISNPASNTGGIWTFRVDVSGETSAYSPTEDVFVIPRGARTVPFRKIYNRLLSVPSLQSRFAIPFGQVVPSGWHGGLRVDGYATFTNDEGAPDVDPGKMLGGFKLQSYGIPTIRQAQLEPFWMYVTDNHDSVSYADRLEGGAIEASLVVTTQTLGPSDVAQGSYAHWEQIRKDLQTAITLHWIADAAFGTQLTAQLDSAKQSLDQQDTTAAKNKLNALVTTVQTATASQLNQTAKDLLALNVQSLVKNMPDVVPGVPK